MRWKNERDAGDNNDRALVSIKTLGGDGIGTEFRTGQVRDFSGWRLRRKVVGARACRCIRKMRGMQVSIMIGALVSMETLGGDGYRY